MSRRSRRRTAALTGRTYRPDFESGKTEVDQVLEPTVTVTFTDPNPGPGSTRDAMSLLTASGTVTKCQALSPLQRRSVQRAAGAWTTIRRRWMPTSRP